MIARKKALLLFAIMMHILIFFFVAALNNNQGYETEGKYKHIKVNEKQKSCQRIFMSINVLRRDVCKLEEIYRSRATRSKVLMDLFSPSSCFYLLQKLAPLRIELSRGMLNPSRQTQSIFS